jgi:hypothetical protein
MNFGALLERLRKEAAEATLVRDLIPPSRRDLFDRVHQHLNRLADDVERVMKQATAS